IGRDVLLSSDAAVVAAYTPTAAPRDLAVRRLDDAGASVVRRGDLVLYYRAAFVPTLCRLVGLDDTVAGRVFARMSTAMTDGVMSLDFDPLALVLRTQCRVTAGADLPARDAPVAFTRVTGPPQMLAVAARLDRLFGLPWWIAAFGDAAPPARTLQIARPVTRGDAPEALLAGAVAWFDDPADTTFDPAAPDAEVALEALGLPRLPAPAMTVFTGGTGQALRARRIDGAVAVTTIAAAAPTAPRGATFGEDGTIRAMSAWLPARADVLVFLSGDAAVDWLRPWMPALPMLGPVDALPRFDRGAPPVAFGLQAETSTVQTTTIVPAAIVRGFYDRVASSFTNR
ncbi:MAG: hypothetical protein KDA25_03920, partial [Phycisphaerales bacterium]|nr:hypothetical protein [Phycisphaerales bacterium]